MAYYLRQSLRREDSAGETLVPELGWKLRMMGIKRVGFRKEDEVLDTLSVGWKQVSQLRMSLIGAQTKQGAQ